MCILLLKIKYTYFNKILKFGILINFSGVLYMLEKYTIIGWAMFVNILFRKIFIMECGIKYFG